MMGGDDGVSQMIPLVALRAVSNGVRFGYSDEDIAQVAESVAAVGILEPLIVRKVGDGYEVVAGMRRYLAAQKLGLASVPCVVRELSDSDAVVVALSENVNRHDMNPVEEAAAFARWLESSGQAVAELARLLGRDVAYISKRLALLDLDDDTLRCVASGELSLHHALELRRCEDVTVRSYLRDMTVKNGASVAVLHSWVDDYRREGDAAPSDGVGVGAQPVRPVVPAPQVGCIVCGRTATQTNLTARFMCADCYAQLMSAVASQRGGAG